MLPFAERFNFWQSLSIQKPKAARVEAMAPKTGPPRSTGSLGNTGLADLTPFQKSF